MRKVVIFVFERANLLDIAGPLQVFAAASEEAAESAGGARAYEVVIASMNGGLVKTSSGVELVSRSASEIGLSEIDTLLVSGGGGVKMAMTDRPTLAWLASRKGKVRRYGSICTGAFLMAAAGLLEGRRATTHWGACEEFGGAFPQVQVETDALFVEDEGLWTSAGVTAGIDMALAMVEQDLGAAVALETARQLVLFLKRSGGQPQFSSHLRAEAIEDDNLRRLVGWILENPGDNLDVSSLASRASMSVRSLFRAFHDHLQTTPREFVETARLETARRMLEQSRERIDRVARKSGFAGTEAMRRAFKRRFRVSPAAYRERFSNMRSMEI